MSALFVSDRRFVPISGDTWEYEVAKGGSDELYTSLWGL